jgi:hypothetical protein
MRNVIANCEIGFNACRYIQILYTIRNMEGKHNFSPVDFINGYLLSEKFGAMSSNPFYMNSNQYLAMSASVIYERRDDEFESNKHEGRVRYTDLMTILENFDLPKLPKNEPSEYAILGGSLYTNLEGIPLIGSNMKKENDQGDVFFRTLNTALSVNSDGMYYFARSIEMFAGRRIGLDFLRGMITKEKRDVTEDVSAFYRPGIVSNVGGTAMMMKSSATAQGPLLSDVIVPTVESRKFTDEFRKALQRVPREKKAERYTANVVLLDTAMHSRYNIDTMAPANKNSILSLGKYQFNGYHKKMMTQIYEGFQGAGYKVNTNQDSNEEVEMFLKKWR